MSADKVGGSKKGQKHIDIILEWSPTYLQIHWGYILFRSTTSSLVYCCWLMNHGIYLELRNKLLLIQTEQIHKIIINLSDK